MGIFDTLLKHLITADAPAFVGWLLGVEAVEVEVVATELLPEPLRADAAYRVTRPDGHQFIFHVEFQGRTSARPIAWRMLGYLALLAERERLPVQSVVIYHARGAGATDTGEHAHPGGDGRPALAWRYQVVHLWRMTAEDLLAVGRRGLLPMLGLTEVRDPARTIGQAIQSIREAPDRDQQLRLMRTLIDLLPEGEMIAMAQRMLSTDDVEELKRFPALWAEYQAAHQAGAREARRADILRIVAARFDPPISDYRRLEVALAATDGDDRLDAAFETALRAASMADVEQALAPGGERA
jgi:predicted transposase YdaD